MFLLNQIIIYISTLVFSITPQASYTEGMVGQPRSFLPYEAHLPQDETVARLLFRGLFKYDEEGKIVNDLADSYEISDDGLRYTIYLKKDQKWSNGTEITADDLLYSSFTSPQLRELATDRIDAYTIRYTLPNKFAPFLNLLTIGVVPNNVEMDSLSPVSSGPYKVVRIKKEGPVIREVVLSKMNEDYNISKLSFRYYENEDQLFSAYKLGEIQGFISEKDLGWKNLTKQTYHQRGVYHSLIFNTRDPKFNKVETRKTLWEATPIENIILTKGIMAKGPISESLFTKKEHNYDVYKNNLNQNLNLDVTLTVPDVPEHIETGEKVKEAWGRVGVRVTLNPVSPDIIEDQVINPRNFEVLLFGQEVSQDPDRYVLWHSTRVDDPGLNLSGFTNIRLDRSLEEGRKELNNNERDRHYDIMQDVIYENVPVIFLYHPETQYYVSKRVQIKDPETFYYNSDRFKTIKDWEIL